MKNVIKIDFNHQAKVGLVTRLNTGTNEVWLSIIGANNGVINLGDITVSITSDDFNYAISSNLWVGDGQLEISVRNSSMTGIYRINKIDELTGDIYIQQDASNLFTLVRGSNFIDELFEEIFNRCYPVGCYFETTDTNFDPNIAWGGTWELETEGLVHVSAGENYAVSGNDQDGGEVTHTLTVDEMPSHNHGSKSLSGGLHLHGEASPNIIFNTSGIISAGGGSNTQFRTPTNIGVTSGAMSRGNFAIDATHTHNSNGGGKAHNNMQPYKVVNRWHRTA